MLFKVVLYNESLCVDNTNDLSLINILVNNVYRDSLGKTIEIILKFKYNNDISSHH